MSRLDATFGRLRAAGERALVAYFTAGDPSLEVTGQLVREAERQGADVVELGVPFSDPARRRPRHPARRARAPSPAARRWCGCSRPWPSCAATSTCPSC